MTEGRISQIQARQHGSASPYIGFAGRLLADEDVRYLLERLAEVTAQRDAARGKLAEAWQCGYDAAVDRYVRPEFAVNPYLPPGEDGPR